MKYEESHTIELKEQYTDTFLKTVSAFANENGGKIIFGINDNGKLIGLKNFEATYPKIERKILDLIQPIPYFYLEIDHSLKIITVIVEAGDEKPYFYNNKTFIRRGTSTVQADVASQRKMILESRGIAFEETPVKNALVGFSTLSRAVKSAIGVDDADNNFLKTCGLIGKDGNYNNAAIMFSDENDLPGIDTVKFDEVAEKFTFRKNFSKCSILDQVEKALGVFEDVFSYEKINGTKRERYFDVPLKAFREALVNAVIHRDWEIRSNIKITFFDDRVEVLSPGTLPKDISKNEYLNGFVSVPRNYIICSMFRKLGYIERMGYGISLIKRAYRDNPIKPRFEFLDNFINVVLPIVGANNNISADEATVLNILKYSNGLSSSEISKFTKISRTKVVSICNALCAKYLIQVTGTGRGTKYKIPH